MFFIIEYMTTKGQCRWWRLSFSAAEKNIINHADGIHSSGKGRTCRKNVLRLLKDDLTTFYEYSQLPSKTICSYFTKTVVLRLCEEDRSWKAKDLLSRYVEALENTVFCLEAQFIEHYFIKDENLLAEKDMSVRELDMIKEYFTSTLEYYKPGVSKSDTRPEDRMRLSETAPPVATVIGRICSFVGWLVRSLVDLIARSFVTLVARYF